MYFLGGAVVSSHFLDPHWAQPIETLNCSPHCTSIVLILFWNPKVGLYVGRTWDAHLPLGGESSFRLVNSLIWQPYLCCVGKPGFSLHLSWNQPFCSSTHWSCSALQHVKKASSKESSKGLACSGRSEHSCKKGTLPWDKKQKQVMKQREWVLARNQPCAWPLWSAFDWWAQESGPLLCCLLHKLYKDQERWVYFWKMVTGAFQKEKDTYSKAK